MTREEKEQTGKYVLQMARLLEDGCYQQEMLLKAVHIIDEALEQEPTENDLGVDCIDRQATLNAIIKRLGISNESYLLQAEKTIYQQIKDMPSVTPQPRWIPVSEKLPEYGKEVLTCSDGGFIEIQSLEDGGCVVWENQNGDWTDFGEIVVWMPLPKSYEPQESEG